MEMFLYCTRFLVFLLIVFLLICTEYGLLGNRGITVAANGNSVIEGPALSIENPSVKRLLITKEHWEHYLPCTVKEINDYLGHDEQLIVDYTWYRNGNVVQYEGHKNDFYIFDNGTLRLPSNERAAGLYHCRVDADGMAVISETITVEYPVLRRILTLVNITAPIGGALTIDCPVLSVPPANVTWFYGNVSLTKKFKENRYLILANGSLVLTNVLAQDGGKYKCVAKNLFATKIHRQSILILTVLSGGLNVKPATLLPTLQQRTHYIPQGAELTLRCRSVSGGLAPIEWWHQRLSNAPLVKLSNYSTEYRILNATAIQHNGYYTCATSKDKQTFYVSVTTPPSIVKQLPSYESRISSSLTFSCRAEGEPTPTLSWYHNAAPLNSSLTRYITANELRIHSFDIDEVGIYQCFARNVAGETSTTSEIRLNRFEPPIENPLHNIRCFAHSSSTVNITFDRVASPLYFISVNIVQTSPHRWTAITPLAPNHSTYIVISNHLPVYRPFELITRALLQTENSHIDTANSKEERILSSLRSQPVTCCTQGLPIHIVNLHSETFVTWSQPSYDTKKYFVLQFSSNYTRPRPQHLFAQPLRGTTTHVELNEEDVKLKLKTVQALNETATSSVMQRAQSFYSDNDARENTLDPERDDIYNLVVPANISGILLPQCTLAKLRVLLITTENEDLQQDFRYVQWKVIENDTVENPNLPFRLIKIESRMVVFRFDGPSSDVCVHVCYSQIQFPIISHEESMCDDRQIVQSQLEVRSLKPTKWYRINFSNCSTQIFYGQKDVLTLADPPGTISNHRITITRQNGLKLSWDPPLNPNGNIHHYNIHWTIHNVTHEANVLECTTCFYKFPHISETSKFNITVRVVGENGIGAPIFIDLRDIDHRHIDYDRSTNSEVYNGIAIGAILSGLCVFCFALLVVCQHRRLKTRQQPPINLTSQSETNFGNLSASGIPGDSAGALSGSTLQHEFHEMQTLIPKSRNTPFVSSSAYQTTQLPNGNGNIPRICPDLCEQLEPTFRQKQQQYVVKADVVVVAASDQSQLPLCASTPVGKSKDVKPYFIPFRQMSPSSSTTAVVSGVGTLSKHSSSPNFQSTSSSYAAPPTKLPLSMTTGVSNGRRSGSLNSGGVTSTNVAGRSNTKHFHTNFPKHSNSNDGICLLAEEESTATITPTSDVEGSADVSLTNGCSSTAQNVPLIPASGSTKPEQKLPQSAGTAASSNNKNSRKTRNSLKTTESESKQRASLPHANSSIVPTTSSAAMPASSTSQSTTSSSGAKQWTATAGAAAAASASGTTAAATKLHRRPTVDPNG